MPSAAMMPPLRKRHLSTLKEDISILAKQDIIILELQKCFYFCQANLEMSGELTFPAVLRLKSCIEGQISKKRDFRKLSSENGV